MSIPSTLHAELAKLNDAQIFALLGQILEPSQGGPFDASEELCDALYEVTQAYCSAYADVRELVDGDRERNSYHWSAEDRDEADRKYFQEYTA